jgi:hypothetical protein
VFVRRVLILGLALGLLGLGPVPLSACSLMSSKLAECASPKTQSMCDQMNMDESGTHLAAASNHSCCFVQAPLPESRFQAPDISLVAAAIVPPGQMTEPPRVAFAAREIFVQDVSPPALQSLLCTFLI